MTPSPEQVLSELTRRVQELEADRRRARSEQARPTCRHGDTRRPWLGALLVIAATWVLAAQAPAGLPPDIEPRLRALESLVRRAPGNITQMTAPFEVVAPDGKTIARVGLKHDGSVPVSIARVEQNGGGVVSVSAGGVVQAVIAAPPDGGVVSALDPTEVTRAQISGKGYVTVKNSAGEQIAGLAQGDGGGGRIGIWRGDNKVIDISTDEASGGSGIVKVNTPSGQTVARLSIVDGGGEVAVSGARGMSLAAMRAMGDAGAVSVMNSSGKAVAGLLGSGTGAGTVAVATSNGATVAEMAVSDDGRGVVQVRLRGGGAPVAVLSQAVEGLGGLVQVTNGNTPVANFTVGGQGGGYFQLADPSGNPTVEAGTLPNGRGTVRAGPNYLCSPAQPATPVMTFGLPDCLVGNKK